MPGSYGITSLSERFSADRLIQLTDDTGSGSADTAKIDLAIVAAEDEFHLYASMYYQTPVTPVPPGLTKILLDLACFLLMSRRPEFLRGDSDEGSFWERRRKELVTWLTGLSSSDRKTLLPGCTEKAVNTTTSGGASVEADTACYTSEVLKEY